MFVPYPAFNDVCAEAVEEDVELASSSSQSDSEEQPRLGQVARLVIVGSTFVAAIVLAILAGHGVTHQVSGLSNGVLEKTGVYGVSDGSNTAGYYDYGNGGKTTRYGAFDGRTDLHDGNACENDEELYDGLCYKKCSLLTNGASTIRTSAFSCGNSHGIMELLQSKVGSFIPCRGFDIAGDIAGNSCPHKPGACLEDEEFSLGMCFKKCSLLTDGVYPHRTTAETCCKKAELLECMLPSNLKFNTKFGVGGGKGSEAVAHSPDEQLTESAAVV